jgi:hypothetical protein
MSQSVWVESRPGVSSNLGLLVRHIYPLQGANPIKCLKTDPTKKSITA